MWTSAFGLAFVGELKISSGAAALGQRTKNRTFKPAAQDEGPLRPTGVDRS
jgi:hypothetical protein